MFMLMVLLLGINVMFPFLNGVYLLSWLHWGGDMHETVLILASWTGVHPFFSFLGLGSFCFYASSKLWGDLSTMKWDETSEGNEVIVVYTLLLVVLLYLGIFCGIGVWGLIAFAT